MSELTQSGQHPDADQLTAFVEHALPPHEREQTLSHLSACADCRAVVALSVPSLEKTPTPQPEPVRKPWFMGWHLAWPAGAAFAALSFVIIHLHNTTPIKSEVPAPTEVATSQPPAPLSVQHSPPASPPAAEAERPNQTATVVLKAPSPKAKLEGQNISKLPVGNRGYAPLPPPQAVPTAGAINTPQAMDDIALAPTLPQSPTAIPAAPLEQNIVVAGAAFAPAAPPPPAASRAGVAATSPQAATGAAINFDSNASATQIAINGRNAVPLSTGLPAATQLPSRLPALSTAINRHLVVAIDTQNTLFYSEDEGKHWDTIPTQWRGRAVRVNLAGSTVTAAQNAAIRTTTASFGSIAGSLSSPVPTTGVSVTGTITDAAGAVVPNASIAITNPTTKATRTVTSDTDGHYRADNLIPGNYQFEATAPGFQKQQLAVNVAASLQNQANITLTVGSVSETVTVEAAQAMPLATTQSDVISRAALKKTAPKAPAKLAVAPLFEITIDNGDRWTSPDGKTWTKK